MQRLAHVFVLQMSLLFIEVNTDYLDNYWKDFCCFPFSSNVPHLYSTFVCISLKKEHQLLGSTKSPATFTSPVLTAQMATNRFQTFKYINSKPQTPAGDPLVHSTVVMTYSLSFPPAPI